ncbi:MAG: hypothetical protein KJ601_02465 [Nanoarchaeota archaeon]|nr:hypothetical protein [Nanoarchaeota archaeon]MBU1703947.1 hypothetical protein [Nanoarchaeota archaeon]
MNKLYIFTIIVIFVSGGILGFIIYDYNKGVIAEQSQQQQEISKIKQEQERITQDFEEEQSQKAERLQQEETVQMLKDEDGDGLTYEEEMRLGTDDNDVDTDGDSIWDNEDRHPNGGGEIYTITVYWTHQGLTYSTQFGIHEDKYLNYKDQERGTCCDDWSKFVTPYDPTIRTIAEDVTDVSLSTGDTNKAQIAINFVSSMIYEKDIDYNFNDEYPKYAIETIVDNRGDCEDTSFLMASILEALGYDTIILIFSDHAAIGVWCETCTGTYYNYNSRKYFFLETTGYADNWEVGRIWGKYAYESPMIIDI